MLTILIGVVVAEALALLILGFFFIRSRMFYKRIAINAEQIAKGKLDVEDIPLSEGRKDNGAVLAGGMDAIKNNMMTFIEATKGNVITLSDAIDVLSSSVNANQAGNEQIAESVTTVATKTAEQMDLVDQNLKLIASSNEQMLDIAESVNQIKEKLDETVKTSKEGIEDLNGCSADMDEVTQDLTGINVILDKFNNEIKQIEAIGDIIIGINNQLTLLAFNASIEAARAGEAGQGFTVVADEMNHMSQETRKGMGSIHDMLEEIMESTRQFNESIKKCEDAFGQSKVTFGNVSDSLKSINQQSFDIHASIQDIVTKTDTITKNSSELKEQADSLHNATQQITDKTHEIAAATQETAAESAQIGENVGSLDGMLDSIQKLLGQFNTSVVPTNERSSKELKIAFLSMLDNDFWYGVRKGVFYAQKELKNRSVLVDYFPINYELEMSADEQATQKIRQCINDHYDGIIFAGFMGGTTAPLKEAIARGIKVVAFNCDCSSEVKRMAVFSPDGKEAGALAGKCMERALNRRGNVAIIAGDLNVQVNKERRDGFLHKISSSKGIRIVEEIEEKNDASMVYKRAVECLKKHSDLDAIYVTSGLQAAVAKAIEDNGRKGSVVTIGFDESPEILSYINKGIIYATIKQDPFGQGHDPIIWLYNHLVCKTAFPREFMGCKLSVVDIENVKSLIKA